MDTRHIIESGYEIADAILSQYGFYKGVDKGRLMDMIWILDDLAQLTDDKWINNALGLVIRRYEEQYQGDADREFLYRFAHYLE